MGWKFALEMTIGVLAVAGLWVTLSGVARGLERVWEWARRDRRVTPLLEDDCDGHCLPSHHCPYCHPDELEELPPERSWQEMTADQPVVVKDVKLWREPQVWHGEARERRAPWWEAEHRDAYESLGFDYPSGLMARVRELTP